MGGGGVRNKCYGGWGTLKSINMVLDVYITVALAGRWYQSIHLGGGVCYPFVPYESNAYPVQDLIGSGTMRSMDRG